MKSQWEAWLAQLRADQKGGIMLSAITRGLDWSYTFGIGADRSADAFACSLRLSPDATGATLADCAVTVGSYASSVTPVTLDLTYTQTGALPADADYDGLAEVVFDLLWTPSGGDQQRLLAGSIPISGKVTSYGS